MALYGETNEPLDLSQLKTSEVEEEDPLDEYTRDFERLQRQKSRKTGGVEARILLSLAFLWGEQYVSQKVNGIVAEQLDENKLNLVFNLIDSRVGKLAGRLFAFNPPYKAKPDQKNPKATAEAEVVDKVTLALDEKLDQPSKTWEILHWLLAAGVVFEYTPWIPDAAIESMPQFDDQNKLLFKDSETGEIINEDHLGVLLQGGLFPRERFEIYEEIQKTGDVGSEILSPLCVFLDQSVKSISTLAPDQAVYVARIRTRGWIEENFSDAEEFDYDKDLKIVTTQIHQQGDSTASLFLADMIPTVQGTQAEDDPDMAVVVDRYLPVSEKNPNGKFSVFIPGKVMLKDADNPYESKEIPLTDFHFKPVLTTFWTKDYVTDLIAPQRFLNKRLSQLGEHANSSIYDKILLGPELKAKDVPSDYPGVIEGAVSEAGIPLVHRLAGPALPNWFLESMNTVNKFFIDIAGGADLLQEHKFPGQLRGPMAVPMLQEILDTEWGPLYEHLGQRFARVKQLRINRVKQFYPATRTMHYTDRNQRDEVMIFQTEKVLRGGVSFSITVERGSLLPELRSLRESRIMERLSSPLSILYMDERTGSLDKSKIAADLQMGDLGRESAEAQARKFSRQLIDRLWRGEQIPQVQQFWKHAPMMDELEAEMTTTEFLSASPQVQQGFQNQWSQHAKFLQQSAQRQQQAMESRMVQGAVAQATQQAAATAASETVSVVMEQLRAQAETAPQTAQRMAAQQAGGRPNGQ
jgi:hypothetical protein